MPITNFKSANGTAILPKIQKSKTCRYQCLSIAQENSASVNAETENNKRKERKNV